MKIEEIIDVLDAELLTPEANLDRDVTCACASDMMSDILAYIKHQGVMLTGLNNPQVIRTAEMMDIFCVVFVRGKQPNEATLELAKKLDIIVLATKYTMFPACGLLYEHGLRGDEVHAEN